MSAYLSKSTMSKRSTKGISLSCHPAATNAWDFWKSLRFQTQIYQLPSDLVGFSQFPDPLWIIQAQKNRTKNYLFFSGFAFVRSIQSKHIHHATFNLVKQILDEEIEILAWKYAVNALLKSLNKDVGLANFKDSINEFMPEEIRRKFFGKKAISKPMMAEITGTSLSAIRWQENEMNSEQKEDSILKRLMRKK